MKKLEYVKSVSQILDSRGFLNRVNQHGPFDPDHKTYKTDRLPIKKPAVPPKKEAYGPFRPGNPPLKGYNSTIGQPAGYMEDPQSDSVVFKKNMQAPIWRDPKTSTTTAWHPQYKSYYNTGGALRD